MPRNARPAMFSRWSILVLALLSISVSGFQSSPVVRRSLVTQLAVATDPEGATPLSSLQIVNAANKPADSTVGRWRPLVSRVGRVSRRVVATPLVVMKKVTKHKGYRASLRGWIRRVVQRRESLSTTTTTVVAMTDQEETAMLQSLASQEASEPVRRPPQQPLAPRKEKALAAKYAAIESIEERAYTILKDLGSLDYQI